MRAAGKDFLKRALPSSAYSRLQAAWRERYKDTLQSLSQQIDHFETVPTDVFLKNRLLKKNLNGMGIDTDGL